MRTAACIGVITIFYGIVALSLAALPASPAWAAAHTVNTPADHDDGTCDGTDCTLREAVVHAGTGDTVTFAGADTYTLTAGEILIDKDLTVKGPDGGVPGDIVISGGGASRVFKITAVTVAMENLTISNGYTNLEQGGGGIFSDGNLTLQDVVLSACWADHTVGGGILNRGTLNLHDCLITGNSVTGSYSGGGIYSKLASGTPVVNMYDTTVSLNTVGVHGGGLLSEDGEVNLVRCTFDQNQTGDGLYYGPYYYGGGLRVEDGSLTIIDSTFSSNSCKTAGGAIFTLHTATTITGSTFQGNHSDAYAGGVSIYYNVANIINCTFFGNTANTNAGALYLAYLDETPASQVSYVTVTDNTADADCGSGGTCDDGGAGGITYYSGGMTYFKGVLVAGNHDLSTGPGVNPDFAYNMPTAVSLGYNLIGNNEAATTLFPEGAPNANNDYVGTKISPLTCALTPLADNGGPTHTCALCTGSLAINLGPPDGTDANGNPVLADQRGMSRVRGGRADVGAYEVPAGGGSALVMLLE